MHTASTTEGGFRRQVTFRIGPDDWPHLEALARAYGGIQAAILAAVRAHAAERLQAPVRALAAPVPAARPTQPDRARHDHGRADSSPPKRAQSPGAGPAEGELVELNVGEAAPLLGIKPESLRESIKEGRRPGRQGTNGFWLAQVPRGQLEASGIALSPRGAGEVLGLTAATIKRRCKAGAYPNAWREEDGWRIPAGDLR